MSGVVSRVFLTKDGQADIDFDEVEEGEIKLNETIQLQDREETFEVPPNYRVTVKKVIPMDKPEIAYGSMKDGQIVIDRKNGTRIRYGGVTFLKKSSVPYGAKAAQYSVELMAVTRDPKV